MARRNLLAEAQVQAAAEVAPQVAALSEALVQAKSDRNAAIHTAAAASHGIGRAINRAGSSVRKAYQTDRLTSPAQTFRSGAIGDAAANERAVTGTALASSKANALKELSDRRIEAAAGRAYRTAAAESAYQTNVAGLRTKRQNLAAQQGLLSGSIFSKLTEAQAGRSFTARQNALDRSATAAENASQRAFTHHEDALTRRNNQSIAGANAQADADKTAAAQKFTAGQNAANRKNARIIAGMRGGGSGGPKPTAETTFKGRQAIQAWADEYGRNGDMSTVAGNARKKNIPSPIINAAADLHSKGHISPQGVAALERMGIAVPKEWTGVAVRSHTRKRRSK